MARKMTRRSSAAGANMKGLTVGKLEDGPRIGPGVMARRVSAVYSNSKGGDGRPAVGKIARYSEE